MEIASIGEGQFILTIEDETLNCLVVVEKARVGDERIDAVHLHGNFPTHRNFTTQYRFTKLTVVDRCCRVRQAHRQPPFSFSETRRSAGTSLRCRGYPTEYRAAACATRPVRWEARYIRPATPEHSDRY